jgi:hypothetical protein
MRKTRKLFALLALSAMVLPLASPAAADPGTDDSATNGHHVIAFLYPVGGSNVFGIVNLRQRPDETTTNINVMAFGLTPGQEYVSLYYDNHTCTLPGDELSDPYMPNRHGIGRTHGEADDPLDEIDSVSVRKNDANLTLLACADIHPEK